jgi:serine/threonine protein phosphatase PrpC
LKSRRKVGVEVHARTDIGRVRERNEDSYLTLEVGTGKAARGWVPLGASGVVLAVCDGLGGAAAGDVASRIAADSLREALAAPKSRGAGDRASHRQLREAIMLANTRVRQEAASRPGLDGMGTTLTSVWISGESALFGQVGDSRGYILRSGRLVAATRDQSLGTALLDLGIVSPDQLDSMHGANILLQAVGSDEDLEIIFTRVSLCRGDTLMVCSDGLSGVISEAEMCGAIVGARSLRGAAERLVRLALEAGGPDNITVVLARVQIPSLPPASERAPRVTILEG